MNTKKYGYFYESETLNEEFLKKTFGNLNNLDNSISEAKTEWVEQCAMWGIDAAKKTIQDKGSPYIFEYDTQTQLFEKKDLLEVPHIEYLEENSEGEA